MSSSGGRGESSGKSSGGSDELFVVVGLAILAILLWFLLGSYIKMAWMMLRAAELLPFSFISSEADRLMDKSLMAAKHADTMSFNTFSLALSATGSYVRWLYLPIMGYCIYKLMFRKSFKRAHTMQSLLEQEAKLWKPLAPIVPLDLVSGDIRKGRWRVSLTEREFAQAHNLLLPSVETDTMGAPIPNLDTERCQHLFVEQLGPVWQGPEALPPYAQAIYAALALKLHSSTHKPQESSAMLEEASALLEGLSVDYAQTNSTKGLQLEWVPEVLQRVRKCPRVRRVSAQHAYVFTVFATLLQAVRRTCGVQSVSHFLWLKPVDRPLFYVMNNVGRQDAYHPEAAAPLSHWLAEKTYQRPLLRPHIGCVTPALHEALSNFRNDDFEDSIYL